jgi:Flp pilus assembly protein TadG
MKQRRRRSFLRETSGNVAMMWGLTGAVLVGLVGLTVDFTRAQAIRHQMQNAADGAALVAERSANLPLAEREAAARAFFDSEMGDMAGEATFTLVPLPDGGHSVSAHMPMPVGLAGIVNDDDWILHVNAEAEAEAGVPVEVVLALDNTGSMSGDMGTLRDGANDLIEYLLGLDGDNVTIGLVPFNAQVNIGSSNTQWVDTTGVNPHNGVMLEGRYLGYRSTTAGACTGASYPTTFGGFNVRWIKGSGSYPSPYTNTSRCYAFSPEQVNVWSLYANLPTSAQWRGCVEERPEPYDIEDAAPNTSVPATMFVPYFALDDGGDVSSPGNNWITSSTYDTSNPFSLSGWTANSAAHVTRTLSVYKYRAGVPVSVGSGVTGQGPNRGCPLQPIVPLTSNENALTNAVNNMVAAGYTNQLSGLAWAWRVISPGAPFTQGRPYDDSSDPVRKVIVLFTDGENTVESSNNSALMSQYNGHNYRGLWNTYQTAQVPTVSGSTVLWNPALASSFRRNGITTASSMVSYFNTRQLLLCNAIKTQGIEVYTVGYRISEGGTADNLLRACATQDGEHYFHADSQSELLEAFNAIGSGIGELRLTD